MYSLIKRIQQILREQSNYRKQRLTEGEGLPGEVAAHRRMEDAIDSVVRATLGNSRHLCVHIELGNDSMRTKHQVACALYDLAAKIEKLPSIEDASGRIRDINGNSVGEWSFVQDHSPRRKRHSEI